MFKTNSSRGIKKEFTSNCVNYTVSWISLKAFIAQKFIIALEICALNIEGFSMKIYGKVMFLMFQYNKVKHRQLKQLDRPQPGQLIGS